MRSYLKPPNESVWELSELVWGRSRYEEIFRVPPSKNPENERYYYKASHSHGFTSWRIRSNWRDLLPQPDPYARIPLHVDPTHEWVLEDGGVLRCPYELWNPGRLFESVLKPGPVVDQLLLVFNHPTIDTKQLSAEVLFHFRSKYLPLEEEAWRQERSKEDWGNKFQDVTWDQHKQKVMRFLDSSVPLISGCLLHHFQVWNETWQPYLLESPAVQEIYADAQAALERKKDHYFTFDFLP